MLFYHIQTTTIDMIRQKKSKKSEKILYQCDKWFFFVPPVQLILSPNNQHFFIVYTWIMTILTPISINTGKTHQWMRLLDPNNVPHYYTTVIILLLCSYYMMLGRWPLLVSHSPPIIFSILASLLVLHIAFF